MIINQQLEANLRNCQISSKHLKMHIVKNTYKEELLSERPIIAPTLVFINYFIIEDFVSFPRLKKVTPSVIENALRKIFNTVEIPENKVASFAGFSFDFTKLSKPRAYQLLLDLCLLDIGKGKNSSGWASYLQDMYINSTVNKTTKKKVNGVKKGLGLGIPPGISFTLKHKEAPPFGYDLEDAPKISVKRTVKGEYQYTNPWPTSYKNTTSFADVKKHLEEEVQAVSAAYDHSYYKVVKNHILYGTPAPPIAGSEIQDLTPEPMNESKKEEGQL